MDEYQSAILRVKRKRALQGSAAKLQLHLDNNKIDDIGNGEAKEYHLQSGQHSIKVVLWTGKASESMNIQNKNSEIIELTCGIDDKGLFLVPTPSEQSKAQLQARNIVRIEEARMGFWRRAFTNALKGGVIGPGIIFAFMLAALIFTSVVGEANKIQPRWQERLDVLLVATALWGALVGFCCTRPEGSSSKMIGFLLVLLAVILSVPIFIAVDLSIDGRINDVTELLLFVLAMAALAGGICGYEQFSKPKGADK